ncbi:hypothetical protein [Chitinimonas lacunae]|uniref:HDOD domain-containing protein n=1 Tax=Chitinimonas lacunae TaxID=1963018 RepID=A0ABV8MWN6_9NEIS
MADALKTKPAGENERWLTFWAKRPLPILQSTKAGLTELATQGEALRASAISDLALQDPLLVAQALRAVNQRERTGLVSDVVAMESVILLMGVDGFIGRFTKLPTVEESLLPKHAAHYMALLNEVAVARLGARLAREFGMLRYDARLDEIFITALLAHLPRMLRRIEPGLGVEVPPVDWSRIALPLFARWRLPEVFATLLDDSGTTNQRALLHQAALRLAERLPFGWWQDGIDEDMMLAAHTLSCEPREISDLVNRCLLYFARHNWPYPRIFPAARWLPMLPGPWPKPQQAATAQTRPGLADILRELQHAGEVGASFNQMMSLAIRAMTEGLGLRRVVFGLLLAGQNALRTRYLVGVAADDPLRSFQVDLNLPHLFTQLMLKPQSVWLAEANRAKLESMLPRGLRAVIGEGEFFAMSLFVEDKPVGLFYADNRRGAALNDSQYAAFKHICQLTGQCLTRQVKRQDNA